MFKNKRIDDNLLTLEMSTKTFAAGLSTPIDLRIVAPSLVISTLLVLLSSQSSILSIPLGPRVLLIKSPIAIAPTNDERRAVSAFSSSAPPLST